jgi:hypothetical protein
MSGVISLRCRPKGADFLFYEGIEKWGGCDMIKDRPMEEGNGYDERFCDPQCIIFFAEECGNVGGAAGSGHHHVFCAAGWGIFGVF